MKGIIKDTLILFAITLVAGLLLGGVYYITKEPIKKQEQITKDKANKSLFADATSFESIDYAKYNPVNSNVTVNDIVAAKKGDEITGYVITVTDNEGYGGDIKVAVGVKVDGTVTGISFLSISETAGLGMNAKNEKFYGQFANKKVDAFEYTKNGASKDNEIDAISSATITSNAVTNAVNGALSVFRSVNAGKDGAK